MFTKDNRFYADWRTPDGKRHRKAFDSALSAKRHETRQKNLAPPAAQSAGSVPSSPKPRVYGKPRELSVGKLRKSSSTTSSRATSKPHVERGPISLDPRATPTIAASAASSKPSKSKALRPSPAPSLDSYPRNHGRSGRPRTKLVSASPVQTSDSAGSSPARSTSGSGTKQLSPSRRTTLPRGRS